MSYVTVAGSGVVVMILDLFFFFSSRRRHTRLQGDWSSDVCSSDLLDRLLDGASPPAAPLELAPLGIVSRRSTDFYAIADADLAAALLFIRDNARRDRKSVV